MPVGGIVQHRSMSGLTAVRLASDGYLVRTLPVVFIPNKWADELGSSPGDTARALGAGVALAGAQAEALRRRRLLSQESSGASNHQLADVFEFNEPDEAEPGSWEVTPPLALPQVAEPPAQAPVPSTMEV